MVSSRNLTENDVQWKDIHDLISICGKARSPKCLAIQFLDNIGRLCSFDQALVYFFDGNGKVCDQYLNNIDEHWSSMYLSHYYRADNSRYSCYVDQRETSDKITLNSDKITTYIRDWDSELSIEFVPNLVRPRGLKYTCGFVLFDMYGNQRTLVAMDRVKKKNFSNDELMNLNLVIPHLNNLHKNFFYQGCNQNTIKQSLWETENLTSRETEIANLLCLGISPSNISRTLHISKATTYKHIAHIYKKLQVSSQQELLVRLLR